jgi:hypothetical protein
MAAKKMNLTIDPENVVFSTISKSKDGYNYARVVCKMGDNAYMSVNYEWEGKDVPDFAMNLMGFMQANELESSDKEIAMVDLAEAVKEEYTEE